MSLKEENEQLKYEMQMQEERIWMLVELNKDLSEQNKQLIEENKQLSELTVYLPQTILTDDVDSKRKTYRYNTVTVLFAYIRGFDQLHHSPSAGDLIDDLDRFFYWFDKIVAKYGLLKAKTIGDYYMCIGGIPQKSRTHAIEMIMAALEIQDILTTIQAESKNTNRTIWELSIGIHTGPVLATITGNKKTPYDIKGETVHMASRIQASGGRTGICISHQTYELSKDFFRFEYKGSIPGRFNRPLHLYQIKGLRPDLSAEGRGYTYSNKFTTKYQLFKFEDLQNVILDKLEQELPKHLYYHNLKHTIDVVIGVEILGRNEGASPEDLLLLKTAALFHDAGQIEGSQEHEARSCNLATKILGHWGYSAEQLQKIIQLIMATKFPPSPETLLEKIICDADLDYLGRSDFIPVSERLYKELKVQGLIDTMENWNKEQIRFLNNHEYYTQTAKKLRHIAKQQQIERLEKLLEK